MNEISIEAQSKMEASIKNFTTSLASLRTGRANAAILDPIQVEYYGDYLPLNQLASVSSPEPRQLVIKPYDKNDVKAIVAAISSSDIGINPINEGDVVRLIIPAMTEERRKDIVKQLKKYAEECKVSIRNIRHDYLDLARADEEMSEDIVKRIEKEIQDVTDASNKKIDEIASNKEKEIMAI